MIYRIACWAGIAAGAAGALAAYEALWLAAVGLGLLAIICAGIVLWEAAGVKGWGSTSSSNTRRAT